MSSEVPLSERDQTKLESCLDRGEQVLWAGKPSRQSCLAPCDRLIIPVAGLLVSLSIVWEAGLQEGQIVANEPTAIRIGAHLVGVAMIAYGLHMLVGRLLRRMRRKRKTVYCVTDRRALILVLSGRPSITSVDLGPSTPIDVTISPSGIGTIRFGAASAAARLVENSGAESLLPAFGVAVPSFFDVEQAEDVVNILRRATAGSAESGP